MKINTAIKIAAVVLLLFNGIGALYGGLHLLLHPDGSSLGISKDWLKHSPFDSFFLPALVLILVNGVFNFFTLWQLVFNKPGSGLFVLAQGALLSGWILIQVVMLQMVYFLHYTLGGVGFALMLSGYLLWKRQKASRHSF
ncbi:MAG: hypothetical protein MUF75_01130 [Bacteroidia bacterium]|nr:hypothetical protein [Bacteroidia bacterium]